MDDSFLFYLSTTLSVCYSVCQPGVFILSVFFKKKKKKNFTVLWEKKYYFKKRGGGKKNKLFVKYTPLNDIMI